MASMYVQESPFTCSVATQKETYVINGYAGGEYSYMYSGFLTLMTSNLRRAAPLGTDRLEGRPVVVGHDHDGRGGEAGARAVAGQAEVGDVKVMVFVLLQGEHLALGVRQHHVWGQPSQDFDLVAVGGKPRASS